MRIPDDVIDAVRAATDIVEVVGEALPLQKAGSRYKACCPFHTEKTPSFTVNPETQMFHCFGCGVGGNVFTFLMRQAGLTFPEAVEMLAERAGIRLPRRGGGERAESGVSKLLEALEAAAQLFEQNLWTRQQGDRARRYLSQRGVSEVTAREARLGYALPGFDHLRNRLGGRFHLNVLAQAGLLVDRDGGRPYDRFRDRLMFPIFGGSGRPIAFGARSLDGSEPKYLNSPETPVYKKREVLYGLHIARRAMMRRQAAWVVEGYMDVLALWQAGSQHVVAVSGTSLTEFQARALVRYAPRVVLLFDGDEAGRKAVVRSLPALLGAGLGVRVALLPPGEDPDSLVRAQGGEALEALVRSGQSVVDFIISLCQQSFLGEEGLTSTASERASRFEDARAAALDQLVDLAGVISDPMSRRLMVQTAARQLDFDEATLAGEVDARRRSAARRQERPATRVVPRRQPTPTTDRRWESLLSLAITDSGVMAMVRDELAAESVPEGPWRRLYERLIHWFDAHGGVAIADLIVTIDSPEDAALLTRLAARHVPEQRLQAARELLAALLGEARRRQIEQLKSEIRRHERSGEEAEVRRLMARVQELIRAEGA